MPSGHKAFLVNNVKDIDILLMHNNCYAAEYVHVLFWFHVILLNVLIGYRIAHAVSSRKRIEIIVRAKQLGVKVTNAKARVRTES